MTTQSPDPIFAAHGDYYGLKIWLQRADKYGDPCGGPLQSTNTALLYAQVGDQITCPRYISDEIDDIYLSGVWVIEGREFGEGKSDSHYRPRHLTLHIRRL